MNRSKGIGASMVTSVALAIMAASAEGGSVTFSAGGDASTASIQGTVDAFRAAIGGPNNGGNGGGPFTTGRREINWDGAAIPADPAHMPADFFNNNAKRGALFDTPGTGFFVSQRDGGDPANPNVRFGSIDPSYEDEFGAFSQQRLFVADGSTITDVLFRIPGEPNKPGVVSGFGAVFTDADYGNSAYMEFYGPGNTLLEKKFVPAATTSHAGFSFLGVLFDSGQFVERVRIVSGNAALGAGVVDGTFHDDGSITDVVAMDDFIYGEPVPAPGVLGLAGAGLVLSGLRRRR